MFSVFHVGNSEHKRRLVVVVLNTSQVTISPRLCVHCSTLFSRKNTNFQHIFVKMKTNSFVQYYEKFWEKNTLTASASVIYMTYPQCMAPCMAPYDPFGKFHPENNMKLTFPMFWCFPFGKCNFAENNAIFCSAFNEINFYFLHFGRITKSYQIHLINQFWSIW